MASPNSPNDLTRQQLDELDTLLQRMLALPLNKPDTVPAPPLAELPLPPPPSAPAIPEPTNWSPPPEFPRPTRPSFLTLTPAPEPEPADDFAPRSNEHRLTADLLPFPIPTDSPPGGPGTLRGVDAPATPVGFVSAFAAFKDAAADPLAPLPGPDRPATPLAAPTPATPPPAASGIGLFTPVALTNRVIEGILDWCGPLGYWLTRPAVKRLLGYVGLVLLTAAVWWTARSLGWVSWPD